MCRLANRFAPHESLGKWSACCRLACCWADHKRGLQRREWCTQVGQVGFKVNTVGAHPAGHRTGEYLTDRLVSNVRTKPPAAGGEEQARNPLEGQEGEDQHGKEMPQERQP